MADLEIKGASPLEGEGLRGDGQAKWYVVHTYSGHENKVKVNIEKMVENRNMQNLILEVVVPLHVGALLGALVADAGLDVLFRAVEPVVLDFRNRRCGRGIYRC